MFHFHFWEIPSHSADIVDSMLIERINPYDLDRAATSAGRPEVGSGLACVNPYRRGGVFRPGEITITSIYIIRVACASRVMTRSRQSRNLPRKSRISK